MIAVFDVYFAHILPKFQFLSTVIMRAKTYAIHVTSQVREILDSPTYIKFIISGKRVTVEGTNK